MTIDPSVPAEGGSPPPDSGIVRAFAPPGPGRHAVVAWARRHARRTGARIEILVAPDLEAPPDRSTDTYTGPIALVGALLGHVWALFVQPPSLPERLGRASAGARLLVVPQSLPEVDVLVDTAYEPVTVVPTDPPHPYGKPSCWPWPTARPRRRSRRPSTLLSSGARRSTSCTSVTPTGGSPSPPRTPPVARTRNDGTARIDCPPGASPTPRCPSRYGSARAIRPSSSSVRRATPGSSWSDAPRGAGSSAR